MSKLQDDGQYKIFVTKSVFPIVLTSKKSVFPKNDILFADYVLHFGSFCFLLIKYHIAINAE